MKTPNSNAGRVTEDIMQRVKRNLPSIETHEYNRTYEAVLDGLENHFKERVEIPSIQQYEKPVHVHKDFCPASKGSPVCVCAMGGDYLKRY